MTNGTEFLKSNLGAIAAGVGGAAIGTGVGYALGRASSKKRRKKTRRSANRKSRGRRTKRRGLRYTPHTAGKRKDTSHRRIRQTKNGQPYIILASGKAKFISKRSAKLSRKRKGGKY